ncbi:MAG: sigma 54-interacting transcriptional regulator [Cyclobacteriaceae bacterium]
MDFKVDAEVQSVKLRFGIVGTSSLLNNAVRVAMQVAPTDMSVLISGESGVGKESFSKIIHSLSHRKHGQFIAINCGAIPEGTIDSELFGHEKGAFTGATDQRKGYFEVTNGGTIFLDEIGEMPLSTQARLLRVLENGEFIKVGSSKVQKTDVRVIAASNVKLKEAVEKGKFREDLFYRLNTVPIHVPALRDRGSDILLLFKKFAVDFAENYRTKTVILSPEAEELLKKYRFPGNIRQLKNLTEQISILEIDKNISTEKLLSYLPSDQNSLPAVLKKAGDDDDFSERDILYKVLFDMKKDMTDMKKLVLQLIQGNSTRNELMEEHGNLFEDMPTTPLPKVDGSTEDSGTKPPLLIEPKTNEPEYEEVIEDIGHEFEEDDSLSLEKKEKEMIIRALRKNNNKRKYAAQDLGISERTLYRKIKNYEIDSL